MKINTAMISAVPVFLGDHLVVVVLPSSAAWSDPRSGVCGFMVNFLNSSLQSVIKLPHRLPGSLLALPFLLDDIETNLMLRKHYCRRI